MKKIFNPEIYQGSKKKNQYFEGWYFKLVTKDQKESIAIIPGVSKTLNDPHAFIQVFYVDHVLSSQQTYYIRYELSDVNFSKFSFKFSIKDNHFTKESIHLNIDTLSLKLQGDVALNNHTPIKKSIISPSIMGFFGYFPWMECYHGVISMSHLLSGSLILNQKSMDFNQGKGYLEKDWGKSFPRAYVWMQSNHFNNNQTSLMFSYADIPFMKRYFKGLIAIIRYQEKEYRFATYNFAKVGKEVINQNHVFYELKKGKYRLIIEATKDHDVELASPRLGKMDQTIKEGLSGEIKVQLYIHQQLIYEDIGVNAGIEIMKK